MPNPIQKIPVSNGVQRKLKIAPPLTIEIAQPVGAGMAGDGEELINSGNLEALTFQEEQERKVLSLAGNSHLARHEIVQEFGLSLAPPAVS